MSGEPQPSRGEDGPSLPELHYVCLGKDQIFPIFNDPRSQTQRGIWELPVTAQLQRLLQHLEVFLISAILGRNFKFWQTKKALEIDDGHVTLLMMILFL